MVPVLLAVYNVRQVPPATVNKATELTDGTPDTPPSELPEAEEEETVAVTRTQRIKLLALAIKPPVIIATPILVTLIVDLCVK